MRSIQDKQQNMFLWVTLVLLWGMFIGMLTSVSAEGLDTEVATDSTVTVATAVNDSGELSIGLSTMSTQLPAPGDPHWEGETGTATWGAVPNSGKSNQWGGTTYYEWSLYRLDSDRSISSASDFQDYEQVRYGGVDEDSTSMANLSEWITADGYYYFTVCAFGDGVSYTDSPYSVSKTAFHYTKPTAKLPTPTGLKWQWLETEKKYFGVWDNIFEDDFINAVGFNVTCYDESGKVYTHLFTRAKLIEDRDSRGRPGAMLYMNNPNGKYRYEVQAVSSHLNQYQSSGWSELSPWVEVHPTTPPPVVNPPSNNNGSGSSNGGSGSGSGSDSGGGSSSYGSRVTSARTPVVQTSSKFKDLATTAKSKGETVARSRGTGEVTVKGSAWSQLAGLSFQHDTLANGAVQVRVTINNPTALTQDIKVSGYVTGKDAERVNNLFDKHFSNATSVMHFDQTGLWGQEVWVAVKIDLTGMDKSNLVFYPYDKAANAYSQIQNPNYSIDTNGYTHFLTPYAGDIIVSNGDLSKKQ